ncbi:MAG: metallophosphoesterase [Desulfobacterota bacterium]|nr:metallophosphoesterase [Thermodesulfobacteriota bacterium]
MFIKHVCNILRIWFLLSCAILSIAILCIIAYAFLIEPYTIKVQHVFIENPAARYVLESRTVVYLSDLHIGRIGIREKKILRMLDELRPDIIFLTGDYVSWKGDYEPALDFMNRLNASLGVWAVMGDYDYSVSRKSCLFCHTPNSTMPTTRHRVRILKNQIEPIKLPRGTVWIAGADYLLDNGSPHETVKHLTQHPGTILLTHEPMVFEAISDNCSISVLAGDTHGGQLALPRFFWEKIGYTQLKYMRGLFRKGRKIMYVTTGIGTSTLPVRFLRPPEIVVVHFI